MLHGKKCCTETGMPDSASMLQKLGASPFAGIILSRLSGIISAFYWKHPGNQRF